MKIGYITIHYGNNFGTVLQTYALYKILKDKLNCEVELIYYFPDHILKRKKIAIPITSIKSLILRFVLPIFNKFISRKYEKFIKKNIITTKKYTKNQLINSKIEYDLLLVGSDQVWNTDYNYGIDDIFYLNFAKNISKRVSYASSFGKVNFSVKEREEIRKRCMIFNHLSVREYDAQKFLNELGFNQVEHVLDPTFLLSKNEWESYIVGRYKKLENEQYVLIYALDENVNVIIDKARKIANEKNMKVFMISNTLTRNKNVDKLYCYNNIFDFVGLVANASFVITNSFHGTVFSIIFNRQFITLIKSKYNSRISSILKLFNLENRMVSIEHLLESKRYLENIDYTKCQYILDKEREKSINYLKKSIIGEVK